MLTIPNREWTIEEGRKAFAKLLSGNPQLREAYLKQIRQMKSIDRKEP